MTIKEVYEKYEHIDRLLSDRQWLPDTLQGQIVCDLWQAIEAAAQSEDVTADIKSTLDWMVTDANVRRAGTGLDPTLLSPQMQLAELLLAGLKVGKIECRRIT